MASLQKITTNLWFDHRAEEAAKFYVSVFKDARIVGTNRYGKEGYEIHKMPEGMVMTIEFEIEGQTFVALNGGPIFKFSEAVSFIIHCRDQNEIDYYWDKLTEGGIPEAQQCGWLKDKFGVSWQVVPVKLNAMLADKDRERFDRVMKAMLQMKKLDLARLEEAYGEKSLNFA
jgi:predicted 3-demethylubiquinone-9 3-methyltransferase (glyoxalase superfamily)